MGLSRLSGWQIQSNEVDVETYQKKGEEQYGFIISRRERENYRMIVSADPIFNSRDEAKKQGRDLVREVRKTDLGNPGEVLSAILGEDDAEVVKEIVNAVNPSDS